MSTRSNKKADSDSKPSERQSLQKSSLTTSSTEHLMTHVALPIAGGSPVDRAKAKWEVLAVSSMLIRVKRNAMTEYLRRISELSGGS